MKARDIIEKLLRGENLSENEIGFFLTDTLNSERVYQETFKRRGGVEYMRTVKRVRGKLYETLWERTATDCAYPSQPYEIKDNPYWQSLTKGNKNAGSDIPKPALSLYLLTRRGNVSEDTYDSCLVCAESEDAAKRIHPDTDYIWRDGDGWVWKDKGYKHDGAEWPNCLENIYCNLIGTAAQGIEKGVVIASFNAG